jgi:hypothetical protein
MTCWSKPVGISGCIHRYFALESVVCDGGGTERTAVHMELEILFCYTISFFIPVWL